MNGSISNGSPEQSASPIKRKADDGQPVPQQRAKRNRYISIACNECKRRKIKCNGQTPCQRCGNLSLECLYAPNCCNNFKDSEEFKRMDAHINSLQEQVDALFKNLNALRSHVDTTSAASIDSESYSHNYARSLSIPQGSVLSPPPGERRSQSVTKHPRFRGPTSSAFNLGVAKSSLETMGITAPEEMLGEGLAAHEDTPATTPPRMVRLSAGIMQKKFHPEKDPIWTITKEEAIRLCRVFQDEMGIMYPIVDIEHLIRHATLLYTFVEAANRAGLMQAALPGADGIHDDETNQLKLVLATAMTLEGSGKSEAGKRMFENVQPVIEGLFMAPVTLKGIKMVVTAGMYHFMCDDESLAWRIIGLAGRQCMELGLHRRETYNTLFANEEERAAGVRLFWAIYCLDRRWTFGTGLPFVLQDTDIDPLLPRPDESTPYLNTMITYSHIGSRVWKSVANADSATPVNKEDIGYLDYQVLQWHRSIPDSLKYNHPSSHKPPDDANTSRGLRRLRIVLYLRANLMRIQIYRPVLHSATSIMENMSYAHAVVDVAKDTIRVLTHVNQTSDIYRSQQVMFNYFLISALAVLFLAVSHAPAQFSESCREEFYMAIDLVRGLSAGSFVSKRLWRTVKVLKEVAPKLGLLVQGEDLDGPNGTATNGNTNSVAPPPPASGAQRRLDAEDPHSSAAVAMAGLAGHQVDEAFLFGHQSQHQTAQTPSQSQAQAQGQHVGAPPNGTVNGSQKSNSSPNGMANDLTSLFEAVGGYGGVGLGGGGAGNGFLVAGGGAGATPGGGDVDGTGWGQEDELTRIMRDLF